MPGKAKVLSSKEIQTILKVLKTERDRALFATGLYTGLRISEIIAIGQNDVYTTSGGVRNVLKVTRLKKKNTVYSNIPIHPKLREMLSDYRMSLIKAKIESPWLFPSTRDPMDHVGRIRAHNILTEAFQALGIDDGSTHSMRRTCLTNMSRAGIPLRTIQEISGHANLGQLQEYLAVDPADSHKAIMSLKY
ncbi:MAG: integrase [Cyanobacteria bacterium DS3.002]|nr:integrase [Cyanobacteria bacterium DS3.002]MBA4049922.1 integrase [Cyanobacteria bacterium DS2.008]MBA4076023.1 integrase [Cyanobacteria bacterium PR.023]